MEKLLQTDYINDLQKIKDTIRINQNKAMVIVNNAMILTYYEIGTIINKRKSWGSKYIRRLAEDLKDLKGYSYDSLKRMAQFANNFSIKEIRERPVPQIPWRSIIEIMKKSSKHEEMLWYINQTYQNGWSRSMIINQFSLKAYERHLINPVVSGKIVSSNNVLINSLFKDTYVFDFIDKENIKTEKDLQNKMIENILKLLNEFGKGFSLVGKEYRLITPTNKEYKIDILLYHTKLHAYIVIEIKLHEFKPSDFGQLIFYVNAIDRLEREEGDNPTIGLLLCKEADSFVAETTLNNSNAYVGISKYKMIEELPVYLAERLNNK